MLRRLGVGRLLAVVLFYWIVVVGIRGWLLTRTVEARVEAYKAAHPGNSDVLFMLEPWPNGGIAAAVLFVPPFVLLIAWYRARLASRPAV